MRAAADLALDEPDHLGLVADVPVGHEHHVAQPLRVAGRAERRVRMPTSWFVPPEALRLERYTLARATLSGVLASGAGEKVEAVSAKSMIWKLSDGLSVASALPGTALIAVAMGGLLHRARGVEQEEDLARRDLARGRVVARLEKELQVAVLARVGSMGEDGGFQLPGVDAPAQDEVAVGDLGLILERDETATDGEGRVIVTWCAGASTLSISAPASRRTARPTVRYLERVLGGV